MIVFDNEIIRIINLIENLANVDVKDTVIFDNVVYVIVAKNQKEKILPLLGIIKKILNKEIRILEYSPNIYEFVKELIPFVNFVRIKNFDGSQTLEIGINRVYRGLVYGRNKRKLLFYKTLLNRIYKIKDIKIV
ncbi:MAG: hypothetical protein QXP34_01950 [Candidatus Aenigmatarchaeota archaeon]